MAMNQSAICEEPCLAANPLQMSEKIRTICIGTRSRSFSSRFRPWLLACMDIRLYQGFGAWTSDVVADQEGKCEAGGEREGSGGDVQDTGDYNRQAGFR